MPTNEQNHQTLQNAIHKLPNYLPPEELWRAIDRRLASEKTLERAIEQLPSYAPPAAVWERIGQNLDQPVKLRRLRPAWWSAAAAAMVILTIGTYFWINRTPEPLEHIQVLYAEIEQPSDAIKADWDEEDAVMDEVVAAFAQKVSFVQNPENQSLLSEWKELNAAKAEIKTMLAKYGNDAELVRTIAEIERQRSTIVKQMATEI